MTMILATLLRSMRLPTTITSLRNNSGASWPPARRRRVICSFMATKSYVFSPPGTEIRSLGRDDTEAAVVNGSHGVFPGDMRTRNKKAAHQGAACEELFCCLEGAAY